MKIYTKTGDQGETSLYGGKRVPKFDTRVQAYGEVDELNSYLGVIVAELDSVEGFTELSKLLQRIQSQLMTLASQLATPTDAHEKLKKVSISEEDVSFLEKNIDSYDSQIPALQNFILPGGSKAGADLHYARTLARRAERMVALLSQSEEVPTLVNIYLNRISDLLFVLARFVNAKSGVSDYVWHSGNSNT